MELLMEYENTSRDNPPGILEVNGANENIPIHERMHEVIPFFGIFVSRADAMKLAFALGLPGGLKKALTCPDILLGEAEEYDHAYRDMLHMIHTIEPDEPIF
jgi:hypothetical protein